MTKQVQVELVVPAWAGVIPKIEVIDENNARSPRVGGGDPNSPYKIQRKRG